VCVFAVLLDGRGLAIDVCDGRIIICGRSSSRNSTKTPPMKRKKNNKSKKQTEASKGRKEGMQQNGGIFCACFFCLWLQETKQFTVDVICRAS
jgi:hypothetical protein